MAAKKSNKVKDLRGQYRPEESGQRHGRAPSEAEREAVTTD